MKIAPAQTDSFLKNPPASCRAFLFYGPDAGQAGLRAMQLARATVPDLKDAFRVAMLDGDTLKDDPARLADEMAAMAMGGGQRLVLVREAGENIARYVGEVLGALPANDTRLILLAGELDKRSKLRSQMEAHESAAAIACYVAEGAQRQQLIRTLVQQAGLKIEQRVLPLLDSLLPADQQGMGREIEKLALYAGEKSLTEADVLQALGDASQVEVDDFIYAYALKNLSALGPLIHKLTAENISHVLVLRALQRHFMRLLQVKAMQQQGIGVAEAMKKLSPPVFWKDEKPFQQQLQLWGAAGLLQALGCFQDAEVKAKSNLSDQVYGDVMGFLMQLSASKA